MQAQPGYFEPEADGFHWGTTDVCELSNKDVLPTQPARSLTLHLEANLALSPMVGRRELAAQGQALVLPGQGHVEGVSWWWMPVGSSFWSVEVMGGQGPGLATAGSRLLQARVGSGTVEVHHALMAQPERQVGMMSSSEDKDRRLGSPLHRTT